MIVVADSSPLNYLVQIRSDALLEKLYARVFVPSAVIDELAHVRAPAEVRAWLSRIPAWIEVRSVSNLEPPGLHRLDPGERATIALAHEISADLLLIDEKQGREEAKKLGLLTIGTLGILLAAGRKGLIDPQVGFQRLVSETTFRVTADVAERLAFAAFALRDNLALYGLYFCSILA